MSIEQNFKIINEKITDSCARSGRNPADITLLAVTKTRTVEEINRAIDCGICNIGENKVQELLDKVEYLNTSAVLHFIGQLQSNKVKYIVDKVQLIHSLDRLSLAAELDKRAEALKKNLNVLVEVNIGSEASKGGIKPADLQKSLAEFAAYKNLTVRGLMTVAPIVQEQDEQRRYFAAMYQLYTAAQQLLGAQINILSMGMSHDYEAAIMEGSNMIRLGTALFGTRKYI